MKECSSWMKGACSTAVPAGCLSTGKKSIKCIFGRGGIKGDLFSDFPTVSTHYWHMWRGSRSATLACGLLGAEEDQDPADLGKAFYSPYLPDEFSFLLPEGTFYRKD